MDVKVFRVREADWSDVLVIIEADDRCHLDESDVIDMCLAIIFVVDCKFLHLVSPTNFTGCLHVVFTNNNEEFRRSASTKVKPTMQQGNEDIGERNSHI